jgi:hypothetical protein
MFAPDIHVIVGVRLQSFHHHFRAQIGPANTDVDDVLEFLA